MNGWFIENHIADLTLRKANAYMIGNISKAKRLEKELDEYMDRPNVKLYLELKGGKHEG